MRAPLLTSSTESPARCTRVRNPSHLGSYIHASPTGRSGWAPASMGSMSNGIPVGIEEAAYPLVAQLVR